jgi:hypothetical protein
VIVTVIVKETEIATVTGIETGTEIATETEIATGVETDLANGGGATTITTPGKIDAETTAIG